MMNMPERTVCTLSLMLAALSCEKLFETWGETLPQRLGLRWVEHRQVRQPPAHALPLRLVRLARLHRLREMVDLRPQQAAFLSRQSQHLVDDDPRHPLAPTRAGNPRLLTVHREALSGDDR